MTESPLHDQTPVEIDTALSKLWPDIQQYRHWAREARSRGTRFMPERMAQANARQAEEYEVKAAELEAQAAPYEAEFRRRGGWRRYFLVTNASGHVHRGMNCSTCYPTTTYAWLPTLSGCDEATMVEEWGEKACTVCFPNAPTLPAFHRPSRLDREAKAQREAEKAKREADKDAKAITAPDGSALRVGYDTIRTKVAAQRALSAAVQSFGWYGPSHPSRFQDQIVVLSAALRAADIDPEPIVVRADKKALKEGAPYTYGGNR